MYPNHRQEKDNVPNTTKTITTNFKSTTKTAQNRIPIRPVIKNVKAPTYKIARHLVKLLNKHITLNNQYNVRNSTSLAADLVKLNLSKEDHQLITYDIKDLYINIPTEETLTITKSMLLKNKDTQVTQQIITQRKLFYHRIISCFKIR